MDSDVRQRLAAAAKKLGDTPSSPPAPAGANKPPRKKLLILGAIFLICTLSIAGYFFFGRQNDTAAKDTSLVPVTVRRSVSFPVYYPDPAKMPAGYTLDQASFSANNQAVVYSVSYDNGKKIAFTVQSKPSEDDLKTFYANQLPLRSEVETPLGTAAIGILNNKALLSLSIKANSWLLVTAPSDIDQEKLAAIAKILIE